MRIIAIVFSFLPAFVSAAMFDNERWLCRGRWDDDNEDGGGQAKGVQAADDRTRHQWDKMMAEVLGDVWVRQLAAGNGRWWRSRAMKAECGRESRF